MITKVICRAVAFPGAAPAPFLLPSGGTTVDINVTRLGLYVCIPRSHDCECNSIVAVMVIVVRWILKAAGLAIPKIP